MKRLALIALLLSAPAAAAFGDAAFVSREARGASAGADEPAAERSAREFEEQEHANRGIENWWDLDYKSKGLPPPFGFALINFGVFAAIMYRLAGKPLKTFVAERHNAIRKDLDEASRLRQEAEAKLKEYEQKVAGVDAEIAALVKIIEKEAEADKERLLAAAAEQAARLKTDAQKQIEAEIERARIELKRGVIEAAVKSADEILRSQIGADDQRKMAERYVGELEKSAAPATGRSS